MWSSILTKACGQLAHIHLAFVAPLRGGRAVFRLFGPVSLVLVVLLLLSVSSVVALLCVFVDADSLKSRKRVCPQPLGLRLAGLAFLGAKRFRPGIAMYFG